MRILVTDGMDKTAMAQLREHGHEVVEQFYEPDQLGEALRGFDVAVVRSKTKVRKEHIDAAKGGQLKLIIRGGVGVDNIDVDYAKANGIDVKNTPRASSQSVAELAMGHMFACARYLSIAGHTMREGKWEKKAYGKGIELTGKTLGIVGFGRIGQRVGELGRAFKMNIVAYDPYLPAHVFEEQQATSMGIDELLKVSDFVTIHMPLTPETKNLFNAESIAEMKDDAVVLNMSRGGIVNEKDMYEALKAGKIGGYAADVMENELAGSGLTGDDTFASPLFECDNFIVSPHIGAQSVDASRDIGLHIISKVKEALSL